MLRKAVLVVFAICATILAGLLIAHAPLGSWVLAIVQSVHQLGIRGAIFYALIYVLVTVLLFPQTPLNLGAGLLYGVLWGSVVVSVASTLAATIAFLLARYCARDLVARKLGRLARFDNIDSAIEQNGLKLVLLMRLQPVFVPFAYLNLGLGLTRVRLLDYVLGTFLGTLPGTILIAYIGSAMKDLSFLASHAWPSAEIAPSWFFWMGLAAVAAFSVLLAKIAHQSFASTMKQQSTTLPKLP